MPDIERGVRRDGSHPSCHGHPRCGFGRSSLTGWTGRRLDRSRGMVFHNGTRIPDRLQLRLLLLGHDSEPSIRPTLSIKIPVPPVILLFPRVAQDGSGHIGECLGLRFDALTNITRAIHVQNLSVGRAQDAFHRELVNTRKPCWGCRMNRGFSRSVADRPNRWACILIVAQSSSTCKPRNSSTSKRSTRSARNPTGLGKLCMTGCHLRDD